MLWSSKLETLQDSTSHFVSHIPNFDARNAHMDVHFGTTVCRRRCRMNTCSETTLCVAVFSSWKGVLVERDRCLFGGETVGLEAVIWEGWNVSFFAAVVDKPFHSIHQSIAKLPTQADGDGVGGIIQAMGQSPFMGFMSRSREQILNTTWTKQYNYHLS